MPFQILHTSKDYSRHSMHGNTTSSRRSSRQTPIPYCSQKFERNSRYCQNTANIAHESIRHIMDVCDSFGKEIAETNNHASRLIEKVVLKSLKAVELEDTSSHN